MPIRKTDKGWWWGKSGPYPTKAKALAVGRAAYASGYKEGEEMATNCANFVITLMHSVTGAHVLHLQTRSYAMHQALGEFYSAIGDLADDLAEGYQGKYGLIEGYPNGFVVPTGAIEYLIMLAEYVETNRYTDFEDTYLQNIVDEILKLIYSTLYKLRMLS